VVFAGFFAFASCRDSEPAPTYPGDISENDKALLPPPGAWHDPGSAKGQAEWRPFKKIEPSEVAKNDSPPNKGGAGKEAGVAAGGVDPRVEEEIRGLLKDYNGLLSEGKFNDAIDFFIKEQAATAKAMIEFLPDLAKKLQELAIAWPDQKAAIEKLAAELEPKSALKLELASLKSASDKKAAGTLASRSPIGILSFDGKAGDLNDVRFIVEGDVWSIDWPALAQVAKATADDKKLLADIDAVITDAKGNSLTMDSLQKKLPGLAAELAGGEKHGDDAAKDADTGKKNDEAEKNSG
jgi:hypothetical protein